MPTIDVYRVRIDPGDVDRLLEIRAAAVAEFQREVPQLERAELVRLDGDIWLDILLWSEPIDPERLEAAAACTPTSAEMHGLIADELGHETGELEHSTAWANAR
jgi:hypothetical protein